MKMEIRHADAGRKVSRANTREYPMRSVCDKIKYLRSFCYCCNVNVGDLPRGSVH